MGIIRDMQRVHATQTAEAQRANTAAAQQRDLIRRNADLAIAAAQQAASDAERQREQRRLYSEARTADAAAANADVRARLADLDTLLLSTLDVDDHIDLQTLKKPIAVPPFDPGPLGRPAPEPVWDRYLPPQPRGVGKILGDRLYQQQTAGRGNVSAYLMISFAVYGSMIANTAAGASVAVERALGWSRQLRLTPLNPLAYMLTKVLTAMVMGAVSVAIVFAVGAFSGAVRMPTWSWVVSGLVAWLCAVVFAAFGLFIGYLVPSENVMQLLGPALALLALMGGIFVPLDVLSHTLQTLAAYTPAYGVGVLARAALVDDGVDIGAVVNVLAWTALFAAGAVWRFRRDTARV